MTKIAIIDLDGVICDSTARFAKAEESKAAYLAAQDMEDADENYGLDYIRKEADRIYWQTAFTPSLVALDTLMDGVPQAIERIRSAGYDVLLLTSRPESMREATEQWLGHELWVDNARIVVPNRLIMKPASQQFVKTVVWKSGVVELLVRLYSVDDLMVIDDEEKTQQAIVALNLPCGIKIGGNLQEAIAILG